MPNNVKRSGIIAGALVGAGIVFGVLGAVKVFNGGVGVGLGLVVLAILTFVLSFISSPETSPDVPPMSAVERIVGMFYKPQEVFKNLRWNPSWLVPVILFTLVSGTYTIVFVKRITAERVVDQQSKSMESMVDRGWMKPEMVVEAKRQQLADLKSPAHQISTFITSFVGNFVFRVVIIGTLYFVLLLVFGSRSNFWQCLAVAAYAPLPALIVRKLASGMLLYVKDPADIHPLIGQESLLQDNLGALFNPAEHPVLFVLGASIGLLTIWTLVLTGIGLRNSGEKVSGSAAWGAAIAVFVITTLLGAVGVMIFPEALS
jgi:Yip1 domain